jgi:hypothetical protein
MTPSSWRARALRISTPQGATACHQAGARDPETILRGAAATLDLSEPAALMLGLLHCLPGEDALGQVAARLMDAMAPGSPLAISEAGRDVDTRSITASAAQFSAGEVAAPFTRRTRAEISRWFSGLDLVEPGLGLPPAMARPGRPLPAGSGPAPPSPASHHPGPRAATHPAGTRASLLRWREPCGTLKRARRYRITLPRLPGGRPERSGGDQFGRPRR